jgi:hypothetical protein
MSLKVMVELIKDLYANGNILLVHVNCMNLFVQLLVDRIEFHGNEYD